MSETFQERRRTPRVPVTGGQTFTLGRRIRVRVVDISANGALLASEEPLPVGTSGQLQLLLGGGRFQGDVRIARSGPAGHSEGYLLGATVAAAEPRYQEPLEDFLRRAGD